MAEEKQTEMISDTLTADDMDVLREVLQSEHSRGILPVAPYSQPDVLQFHEE